MSNPIFSLKLFQNTNKSTMATPDKKLAELIEKAFEAKVTLGQPPASSTSLTSQQKLNHELDYVSVNDVILIFKQHFETENIFELWISRLACEVSEDGQVSNAGSIALADILENVNERIFIRFSSLISLLEHLKTLNRALGE